MSSETKGIYPHLSTPGQKPSIDILRTYGIAINLPDRIMYTLNVVGEPIALPLSLDIKLNRYKGYGVPLEGFLPASVPQHVREGKVQSLADVFMHIYYSLPISETTSITRTGDHYTSLVTKVTEGARVFTVRRLTEGGVNRLELRDNLGNTTLFMAPEAVFEARSELNLITRDYRTEIIGQYTRARGNLRLAEGLRQWLPEGIDLDDPALDLVFSVAAEEEVKVLSLNIGLVHYRYGTPILNSLEAPYNPIELSIVREATTD